MTEALEAKADAAPLPATTVGQAVWQWWPAGAAMLVIFAASGTEDLRAVPGGVSDHAGHFVGYLVLGALMLRGFSRARWEGVTVRSVVSAWLATALYGATDEIHQRFVPGRTPAVDDWIADLVGAGTALALLGLVAIGRRVEDRKV